MQIVSNIKTKDVISYATMPRVVPRFKTLFSSGFGYVAFLMAHIYLTVRLLPANHPYLKTSNIGRYGFRHVIAEASRNLTFSRSNIDQIIIYFALLMGAVMLFAQFIILIYSVFIQPAMAFSWFDTADPAQDVAYELLDRVFGVPEVFCSSITPGNCTDYVAAMGITPGNRLPFHLALHELFRFYSTGLLLIAVLIFLYFVFVIVLETAVTGAPFGQRFQNVWVPIRLVVALGLLMPINYGLNSGQFIVLYAAKWGSSFATNGWNSYNTAVANHNLFTTGGAAAADGVPLGERWTYIALPEAPDLTPTLLAMSIVHACAYSYHRMVSHAPGPGAKPNKTRGTGTYPDVEENYTLSGSATPGNFMIQPYLVKTPISSMADGPIGGTPIVGEDDPYLWIQDSGDVPYMEALGFYFGGDIVIRFGERRLDSVGSVDKEYKQDEGGVKPLCGDIRIPVGELSDPGSGGTRGGADAMREYYYNLVKELWFDDVRLRQFARMKVVHTIGLDTDRRTQFCSNNEGGGGNDLAGVGQIAWGSPPDLAACQQEGPNTDFITRILQREQADLTAQVQSAWGLYVRNGIYGDFTTDIREKGWGGAGIWYNKIAEINGGWMDGVRNIPTMTNFPLVMEQIKEWKQQHNENIEGLKIFDPTIKPASGEESSKTIQIKRGNGELIKVGEPLASVFAFWTNGSYEARPKFENIVRDSMNMLLGTSGLLAIRKANKFLHPLAQLVAVGKGLVNSAVFDMGTASVSAFLGGMLRALGKNKEAGAAEAASQMFFSIAFMGLTAGFVLFYVLPFLPFVYFYFAVGSWVKAIFEAMVGVPLWALAHLRIDGDGLPGDAAQNGYFLILEIFIRPILTIFGLVAAVTIFAAQVRILNLTWDLAAANMSGHTSTQDVLGMDYTADTYFRKNVVDEFFFTVIYTIVVYMLALASFKLIDKIPDNILRWAGAGVSSFGDMDNDHADGLSRYAAYGGMTVGNQAAGAVVDLSKGMGGTVGGQLKSFGEGPTDTTNAPSTSG